MSSSHELIAQAMRDKHGQRYGDSWLQAQLAQQDTRAAQTSQEPFLEHSSHLAATKLLKPVREALGAAYETLHAIARWSIEHATEEDPAPHLMTTYWTLEEITGKRERTLRRHLVEDGHPWSETVKKYIDLRHNYGTMLEGDKERTVIIATVIRFFPRTRQSPNARVKRWGQRDLMAEADDGRTRPTRPKSEKARYWRQKARMSAYRPFREQCQESNWLMVKLGQTISNPPQNKDYGSLYADIPRSHVLNALRADLGLMIENAQTRGASVKRARALWVDRAAQAMAARYGDDRPKGNLFVTAEYAQAGEIIGWQCNKEKDKAYPVYKDGFTNLWRKALWTAVRAEMYGGTTRGWVLLEKMSAYAYEAQELGKSKPTAWAWTLIKAEGFAELLRDYDTGAVA